MNLALSDVLGPAGPNVGDSGTCDVPMITDYVNRAQGLLIHRLDSKGTVWPRCVPVCAEVFALPPEFLEVRSVLVDGKPAIQRDQYFESNSHMGHRGEKSGGSWHHYCEGNELIDLGDLWAIPTLLPQILGAHLAVTAQLSSDAGRTITLQVLNRYGDWVTEGLKLLPDQQMNFTATEAYDVRFVTKPLTAGNVNLYLVAPDNTYSIQAVYGPKVTRPSYRRKRLPKHKRGNCPSIVKIMGKLRFYPALVETDQLVIGNLEAIVWAIKAITAQTIGDVESYNSFLGAAEVELLNELRDDESEATVSPIEVRTGVRFNSRHRFWR